MACKISWTPRAWKTYEANIEYLLKEWTEKEVSRFVSWWMINFPIWRNIRKLVLPATENTQIFAIRSFIKE